VLDLYDPGRLRSVRRGGALASWDEALAAARGREGYRPWFVLPPQSSELIGSIIGRLRARYPAARFTFASPISRRHVYEATNELFNRWLEPQYDFARARLTLSLGADFLAAMPMSVRWSRDFASARRVASANETPNRLYVIEPSLSVTGSNADHRVAARMSDLAVLGGAILGEVLALRPAMPDLSGLSSLALPTPDDTPHSAAVRAIARDLASAPGRSVIIAGDQAPVEVHLIAHALNAALGNWGETLTFTPPALLEPEGGSSLFELATALDAGAVDAVFVLDDNLLYWAPPALELERRLRSAPSSFHLTAFENETSRACRWVLPLSHYLESWGDARSADGTTSLIQPLIEPLHPSRSVLEVLAACAGDLAPRGHTLLMAYWRQELGPSFDADFDEYLRRGVIPGRAAAPVQPRARWAAVSERLAQSTRAAPSSLALSFEPSPSVYDGRFANNAWLLELPHPITKQTWGNAAVLSPQLAANLSVSNGQVLELSVADQRIEVPALIIPGQADGVITLSLGYGQSGPHIVGRGHGANAYRLREDQEAFSRNVGVRVTGRHEALAITQNYSDTRGRPLAMVASLAEYRAQPDLTAPLRAPAPSLLPAHPSPGGPQWAMTIDTSICTGCSSCVIACQAENNVPVVGKEAVERGREMHWLRIDRYFSGPESAPTVVHQPMLCQHCETAPCEYVCPVNATVHSPDGLNEMVYNRCIGTRFCSNNCPYKVRRFNWFEFTGLLTTEQLARNPDVTVRERGVMEKCTYCVQRIRRSEMHARVESREIQPGEVVTACQQACPTGAIQFGSLEHTATPMVEWRNEGRAYSALHDLGTRPRTTYLTKLVNPNPELEG
jgi:Fe-S-cluster-containing dehydrogenase component